MVLSLYYLHLATFERSRTKKYHTASSPYSKAWQRQMVSSSAYATDTVASGSADETHNASSNPFAGMIHQSYAEIPSFTLESGVEIRDVPVAFKTWGKLNENGDNCMVICHALTGSADMEDW